MIVMKMLAAWHMDETNHVYMLLVYNIFYYMNMRI